MIDKLYGRNKLYLECWVLKSPFFKGGIRGIIGGLFNPPYPPLGKGGGIPLPGGDGVNFYNEVLGRCGAPRAPDINLTRLGDGVWGVFIRGQGPFTRKPLASFPKNKP
jgi:hypothetical protein